MLRIKLTTASAVILISLSLAAAGQTPPIQPKVQETPLPPPVEITAPADATESVPNKPLTADEAAAIALLRSPSIAAARAQVDAAQGRDQQSRAGLLPSVSVGATYNNDTITYLPTGQTQTIAAAPLGYQTTASVKQLLYDFNHTRDQARQAGALTRAASAGLNTTESNTVFQVKQAFYSLVQSQRLVSVNEANVHNQQNHVALAKARLDAGVGLPNDVVRAETAVANAVFNLNLARNQALTSRVTLAQLMGVDPRVPVQASETTEPAAAEADLDTLVQQAVKDRPEMRQAQWNVSAANLGMSAARTNSHPALTANAGWLQRGSDFPPDARSLTYGLSIAWPVFDGGLTKGKITEAQANLANSRQQMESTRLAVISEVSQAYLNLKTAEQRAVTADAEVANASESVRLTEGRYKAGMGIFLDVLDAQTALLTAQTNRVNAQSAIDQARVALARAIGTPRSAQAGK